MKSRAVHFFPKDVLYGRLRPYLNKVITLKFQGLASAEFIPLTLPTGISPSFIQYRLNSADFVTFASAIDNGDRPRVDYDQIGGFDFLIPPYLEQLRIVHSIESYFSRLDDAVAALERVRRNLKRYRASVLKAAVEGRLVPTEAELARRENREYEPAGVLLARILEERRRRWIEAQAEQAATRAEAKAIKAGKSLTPEQKAEVIEKERVKAAGKYKEPAAPDTTNLPDLPEGWCWATLSQLGELNRGKSKHRPRNDPRLLDGPYPFIQTGEVRKSDGFITDYHSTYSEYGLQQSRLWPSGTLCITIAANIAETGILSFPACFPDSIVGFCNSENFQLVQFIELFIRTAKSNLEEFAPATAQKNINLSVLSNVFVPLPPIDEQSRIVDEVHRLITILRFLNTTSEASLTRCQRLRQSILKWAFEGRLVDQDPNDEPASVLLERIKQERATLEAATKNNRKRTGRKGKRT
ncbi:restriction endonuclease subunit S [bacterium]|nr:restriction endonuclease subunit S [candidate division CSSED10-310 bacterium]